MHFIHTDLGNRRRGEIVEVTLTRAANVRLMNTSNFNNYKNGRKHKFHGGLAKRSPTNIAIPSSGHWHLTVDMQGLRGSTEASVRVLPGALPEIRKDLYRKYQVLLETTCHLLQKQTKKNMMFLYPMHLKTRKILLGH